MRAMPAAWGALCALLPLLATGPASAQTGPNETCLTCHSDRTVTRSSGAGTSVFVNGAAFASSAHRGLACLRCHADAKGLPHAPKLARVRCSSCHAGAADSLARSVHAGGAQADAAAGCAGCHGGGHEVRPAARVGLDRCASCHPRDAADFGVSVHGVARARGDLEAATCDNCHGPAHAIRSHRDDAAPTSRARLAETCGRCHADRELMTRRKITIPEAYTLYAKSVHGRSSRADAARCNDCHESHRLERANDPASSIYRANIPATCGRCHPREQRAYGVSTHGEALRRGVTAAPACTDCHGEHMIRGPRDPGSPVVASAVTTTCSRCHEAQGIRETFGLPAGRLSTYQDSFHGLAARGGSPAVANCASCHGYHDVLPSSDPRSAVSPQRLPETCGKCHPGAGTRFALGPVHVAMATLDNPVLFIVRWIYIVLIVGTIGGMALHQGLDFVAKLRAHWRGASGAAAGGHPGQAGAEARVAPPGPGPAARHTIAPGPPPQWSAPRWYLRMTLSERIQHALLSVSFFTLVYTGFALKFPEAWPFAWFARLEHGYSWRGLIHRGAAVVMLLVAFYHAGYLFTARGRGMFVAMLPGVRDARELIGNLLHMMGLRHERPRFDRFSYVEKAEYWALIWGTAVMTLTGVVLWFENQSLRWLDKWMLDLATIVHYYEAWLAFLAILVWHIYQNVLNPDVYPMNWTWITGRISEGQLRHEHPAEWERVAAAERAAESNTSPPGPERAPGGGTAPADERPS
jgi:cytochrome b subunit of formate dehydrogenase